MNLYLPNTLKYQLAIFITIIVLKSLIFGGLIPEIKKYQDYRARLSFHDDLSRKREIQEIYEQMKEEKEVKANYIKGLEKRLIASNEKHMILESFQELANSSGITLMNFQFFLLSQFKIYPVQKLQIIFQGSYPELLHFLALTTQRHFCHSLKFLISPKHDIIQCQLTLEIYLKSKEWRGEN